MVDAYYKVPFALAISSKNALKIESQWCSNTERIV